MKTLTALTMSMALATSVMAASAQDNSNQPTGQNWQRGAGRGYGLRNGTGPRAQMGTCPLANNNQPAAVAPAQGNRGPGFGIGNRGGRGQGQRGGWGPRDGTGPRAQWGGGPLAPGNASAALNPAPASRGPAYGAGFRGGRGWGGGPRNGTGPRAQMGTCPLVNDNQPAAVAPAPGNRGPGFGIGNRDGRGQGQRGGWGPRDGTGPRAQAGACPLVNPPAK